MSPKPLLVIDGSGSTVFAGVLDKNDRWLAQVQREGAPLEDLFPTIESALQEAGTHLNEISAYLYCEGPGSVLGLRLCAMAIETWTRLYPETAKLYKYNSLQLCALALLHDSPDLQEALLVSDWKKGAWNALTIESGKPISIDVIDDTELVSWKGPLYHLPQRKGWQSPPPGAQTIEYSPARIAEVCQHPMFLQATKGVQLYSACINTFQKWTPTRHRA